MARPKIVNKIYELAAYAGEESGGPRWAPAHYRRSRSIEWSSEGRPPCFGPSTLS
jgi:hypothetical protein